MSLEQLSSEQILNLSPDQLKEYVQKYKEKYHIETERNFDARLPDNVDCLYDICKYAWSVTRQKENVEMPNHISMNKATLPDNILSYCGIIITNYIKQSKILKNKKIKIIDPFAGNGYASKLIQTILSNCLTQYKIKYIASDFQNLSSIMTDKCLNVEFNIDCIDSIEKHKKDADILLLNCPPPYVYNPNCMPSGFADYFSVKKWTDLNKKILIFIGELGRTEGTEGMYHYLMNNNPVWKICTKYVIMEGYDLFGKYIQREIFIFENKNAL